MNTEVYIFNPDNDLALAQGGDHYVAPPFARKLAQDLCVLPMWYAPPGSCILVAHEKFKPWVMTHGQDVAPVTKKELVALTDVSFRPWGWSTTLRKRLTRLGVAAEMLPTIAETEKIRELAHRNISIVIHEKLRTLTNSTFSPIPLELKSIDEIMKFASDNPGCFLKSPWSGSGQGVYRVIDHNDRYVQNWCRGVLKKQGSVLCEKGLNKIQDFAIEFDCTRGRAELYGFSIFINDFHSQYLRGHVSNKDNMHRLLLGQCPQLDFIVEQLATILNEIITPYYKGFLGIDMLLYEEEGHIRLNPCVELNLRTTMGVITSAIGNNMFKENKTGKFKIDFSKDGIKHKTASNRLYLTPVFEDTQYCAYIDIDERKPINGTSVRSY